MEAELSAILEQPRITTVLHVDRQAQTTVKLRVMSKNQQLLRADLEAPPAYEVLRNCLGEFRQRLPDTDVVLVSDYGKGGVLHIEGLWGKGATVSAYDPVAAEEAARTYGDRSDLRLTADQNEALDGADALVIVTEGKQFRSPDFDEMRRRMRQAVIFDGRNIFDLRLARVHGFEYYGIGR